MTWSSRDPMIIIESILDVATGTRVTFHNTKAHNYSTGEIYIVPLFEATVTAEIKFIDGQWQRRVIDTSIQIFPNGQRSGWVPAKASLERLKTYEERKTKDRPAPEIKEKAYDTSGDR